jgi:hypothetical protein
LIAEALRSRRDITDVLSEKITEAPLPNGIRKGQPNTALMSTVLMLGTFVIAYFLRHFRNSHFLGRSVRTQQLLLLFILII